MNDSVNETLKIEQFFADVVAKVKEGMEYRDAIQLCAVITGGQIASLVSQADTKSQEATYHKTELFKQTNVDECALASMGKLWHGENFEGSSEYIDSSEEEIILDSLYFVLKYAKSQSPLKEALEANECICGDKIARKRLINMVYNV